MASYTDFTWMRALNRTVTQISPTHYRIDVDLSPIQTPPGVTQFWTSTNTGGCEQGEWPDSIPAEGSQLVGFLALRDELPSSNQVPIGNTAPIDACDNVKDVSGTGWTFIDAASSGFAGHLSGIMLAQRVAVANEPRRIRWGGTGGFGGSARPRSHQVEVPGVVTGAPSVAVDGNGTSGPFPWDWFTSPNVTVAGAGFIFAGFGYACTGPSDGSSAAFTLTARSPAQDLTQGFQEGGFGGYSWFGLLRVEAAGTYNVTLDRSAAPRTSHGWWWEMGFWADA